MARLRLRLGLLRELRCELAINVRSIRLETVHSLKHSVDLGSKRFNLLVRFACVVGGSPQSVHLGLKTHTLLLIRLDVVDSYKYVSRIQIERADNQVPLVKISHLLDFAPPLLGT